MPKDLDELRERKKELLLESDINRQIVVLESSQIKLKAVDWRHNLMKAGAIYKWVAPLAGVGFGLLVARKQVSRANARAKAAHHNGNGKVNPLAGYATLITPLGIGLLKQALGIWRHRKQRQAYGAE